MCIAMWLCAQQAAAEMTCKETAGWQPRDRERPRMPIATELAVDTGVPTDQTMQAGRWASKTCRRVWPPLTRSAGGDMHPRAVQASRFLVALTCLR